MINRYEVQVINPDTGAKAVFDGWLVPDSVPSFYYHSDFLSLAFRFRSAWRIAQQLRRFYPIVKVVAVRA